MMDTLDLLPAEVEVFHLLWALYWLKCYPTKSPATATVGKSGHKVAFRKYIKRLVFAISDLEPNVVSECVNIVHITVQLYLTLIFVLDYC